MEYGYFLGDRLKEMIMIMGDKCISPVKIEVLSANKKILRQLPRQSEISKEAYNSKMLFYEKVLLDEKNILGSFSPSEIDWRTGTGTVLLVKFGECDYRIVPHYSGIKLKKEPPNIIIK